MIAVCSCYLLLSFLFYPKTSAIKILNWNEGVFIIRTIQSEIKRTGLTEEQHADPPSPKKKVKEQFSKWEIEELMGYRRDKFKRVRGSVRRK